MLLDIGKLLFSSGIAINSLLPDCAAFYISRANSFKILILSVAIAQRHWVRPKQLLDQCWLLPLLYTHPISLLVWPRVCVIRLVKHFNQSLLQSKRHIIVAHSILKVLPKDERIDHLLLRGAWSSPSEPKKQYPAHPYCCTWNLDLMADNPMAPSSLSNT